VATQWGTLPVNLLISEEIFVAAKQDLFSGIKIASVTGVVAALDYLSRTQFLSELKYLAFI
jgi:hypothetical protein